MQKCNFDAVFRDLDCKIWPFCDDNFKATTIISFVSM